MEGYTLFYRPGTCAVAPHIILEYLNVPYTLYLAQPNDPELLVVNPLGAVPTLNTPKHGPLIQNQAILKYLARQFSEANIGPNDTAKDQYYFDTWMCYLTGDWHPTFWPYYNWQRFIEHESEAENIKQCAIKRILQVAQYLDQHLQQNTFVLANRFTIVDAYAFAIARFLEGMPINLNKLPGIQTFLTNMRDIPAVQTVLQQQNLS